MRFSDSDCFLLLSSKQGLQLIWSKHTLWSKDLVLSVVVVINIGFCQTENQDCLLHHQCTFLKVFKAKQLNSMLTSGFMTWMEQQKFQWVRINMKHPDYDLEKSKN